MRRRRRRTDENDEDVSPSLDVQRLPMLRDQGLVP